VNVLNWKQYSKYLDVKIADAHYVLTYNEKKYKEAKAQHEAALREKESFEKALDGLVTKSDV
jgi:hypothetical protein